MARLSDANLVTAREIMARFPRVRSALIPLVHLAQEQDGHVTEDAMAHIAELLGITPAEVYGTATFYEMFKFEPVGRYCVNVCTNISCQLLGAWELLEHAEERLGVKAGGTTADGMFTLEDVECIAACTEAPGPPGELPLPLQGDQRRPRPAARRPAGGPARRRDPAPRHAGARPPEGGSRPVGRHSAAPPRPRSTPDE